MGYANNHILLDEFHNLSSGSIGGSMLPFLAMGKPIALSTVIITDPKGELLSMFEHMYDADEYEDLANMCRTECL